MADPYVIFPGTDYLSTPDTNVLDSDTAHQEQGVGNLRTLTGMTVPAVLEPAPDASFGSYAAKLTTTSAGNRQIAIGSKSFGGLIAVSPSTEYTVTIRYKIDVERSYRFFCVGYDASEVSTQSVFSTYTTVPSVGAFNSLSFTLTTDSDVVWLEPTLQIEATQVGDNHWIDVACVREGSDPTFTPSLRIVGTLFEEIVPADMPVVFAADGTPLTVGDGWAGDGYSYRRYDGADASSPLVASFLATDIPVAAQLPA